VSRAAAVVLATFVLVTSVAPVAADEPVPAPTPLAGEVVPGEVIVKYHDPAAAEAEAAADGLEVVAELGTDPLEMPLLVSTEGQPVQQVVAQLNADPAVEYAEPNYVISLSDKPPVPEAPTGAPEATDGTDGTVANLPPDTGATAVAVNDPRSAEQYSLDRMQVRSAWGLTTGGGGIVAVLDTGVQYSHPDLAGRLLPGYDFVNDDADATDDNGHGTWVSGIIAANSNDGYGIAGISWSDQILPVKMMNHQGLGNTSDLTSGIVWAANHGATVINMSVGGFPYSQFVQDAVNYAWSKGAVLVGAAGNNRQQDTYYPASFTNVINVSATQEADEFSNWSSYGPTVDVSAPGSTILTTNCTTCTNGGVNTWGSHVKISGTSFATPNTAGVIALIRARYPSEGPAQIVSRLMSTLDDQGYPGWDNRYGHGRVNAARAVGGGTPTPRVSNGDGLEANNTLASARGIALGSTVRPSLHPAGDMDTFYVDIPRAGRLDVRATGVVDTSRPAKSALPIDPIIDLYSTSGALLASVDNAWESGVELASYAVTGPTRIIIRIRNYYTNGSTTAYSVTPTYVDDVHPVLAAISPAAGATKVRQDGIVSVDFSEPVSGVSASTMRLIGPGGGSVPATVEYGSNRATLRPSTPLIADAPYTVTLSADIRDAAGNPLAPSSWSFVTAKLGARIAGADRFATSAAISAAAFPSGAAVAYIATGRSYPDALAGGPAAAANRGPLLLVDTASIPAATAAELSRLRPGRIVVLGSSAVVSNGVASALGAYTSGGVTRIGGADRYATAAAISAATFLPGVRQVYIATGANYPDALAAGAAAGRVGGPILLARAGGLPAETAAELARLRPAEIVVMGGPSVVSDAVLAQLGAFAPSVRRVAGADRFATAAALSQATAVAGATERVYIATGASFPDGLSAGPVAGLGNAPLLLVKHDSIPPSVVAELRRLNPSTVVIVGGPGVVSDGVLAGILALWP
jgi:subtilisin family serine protease/putative cell wall-binding protein